MKTSMSSKAFCSITDRQTDKIFTEEMLIYEGNLQKKIGAKFVFVPFKLFTISTNINKDENIHK